MNSGHRNSEIPLSKLRLHLCTVISFPPQNAAIPSGRACWQIEFSALWDGANVTPSGDAGVCVLGM